MSRSVHVPLEDCVVDAERGVVRRSDGGVESLTTLESRVLAYFAAHPDRDLSRDELLEEVWGYAAGVDTRAAYFTIRRLRAKLEADPNQPRHILNVRGFGWRFVPLDSTLQPTPLPAPPASRGRTNLAAPDGTRFRGRDAEVERLWTALDAPGLVTLLGSAGMGKTRLAKEVGCQRANDGTEVWFCDLTAARTASDVEEAVAGVLGLGQAGQSQIGVALSARGSVLLILDNFEQIVPAARTTLGVWLAEAPQAVMLVTSRERLRLRGETVIPVGPLPIADAVALMRDRAASAGRPFPPDAGTDATLENVVAALDALPLALELAAARLRMLSPEGLLERLDDRFRLLARGARDALDRHTTLRAAIDWSWRLLDPFEQATMAQCTLFEGGFWLEDAEAVVAFDDPEAPTVLDLVQSLCDKSLLVAADHPDFPGELRLSMYESIRVFAADHRCGTGDVDRHARWFIERAVVLARRVPACDPVAIRQLRVDVPNLLAAMDRTVDPGQAISAAMAVDSVQFQRESRSIRSDRLRRVLQASESAGSELQATGWACLARVRPGPESWDDLAKATRLAGPQATSPLRFLLAVTTGHLQLVSGQLTAADVSFSEAAAHAGEHAGRLESALQGQLSVTIHRGDVLEAGPLVERLVASRGPDDPRPWDNLAVFYARMGDQVRQQSMLQHDLKIHEALGQPAHAARVRLNLGQVWGSQGRPEAIPMLHRCREEFRILGERRLEGVACALLSGHAIEAGDVEGCRGFSEALLAIGREIDHPTHVALSLQSLAWLEVLGERDATVLARRALAAAEDAGDYMLVQLCTLLCALTAARRGAWDESNALVLRGRETPKPVTDEQRVLVDLYLGLIDVVAGRPEVAQGAVARAEPWARRSLGVRLTRRVVLDCLGWVSSS